MNLFKKKIEFPQFIANLIKFQFDLVDRNFEKWVVMDDEFKVLTSEDKKKLHQITDYLILADIHFGCLIHLSNKISRKISDDGVGYYFGYVISSTYVEFLYNYRKMDIKDAQAKGKKFTEFWDFFAKHSEKAKKMTEEYKKSGGHPIEIKDDGDRAKADLCSAFGEYYSIKIGNGATEPNGIDGRNYAAFKFAMAMTKADLVGYWLKEYKVEFDSGVISNLFNERLK